MSSDILFANNATSTIAGSIGPSATSCQLASGTGVLFPNPTAGDYFIMTFVDAATGLLREIVHVTARSSDICTIVRAQEGTAAQSWNAGDIAANLVTAGSLSNFVQSPDLSIYAPLNSPTLTGVPLAPTPSTGDNSTKIATTAYVQAQGYAPLNSPTLTGTPLAPTQAGSDNSTKIATTAFVKALNYAPLASPSLTGTPTAPTAAAGDNTTTLATTAFVKNQSYATTSYVLSQGFATTGFVTSQGYITAASLAPYATTSFVTSQGYITGSALGPYATTAYVNGLLNTQPGSGYAFIGNMLMQWGNFSAAMTGSGVVTLPGSFANSFSSVVVTPSGASGTNNVLTANAVNNGQFVWAWPSTTGGTFNCYYIALGF